MGYGLVLARVRKPSQYNKVRFGLQGRVTAFVPYGLILVRVQGRV
jgi:hypothetical protein